MKYYSDDMQDIFVACLLNYKRDGYYVDIGSSSSVGSNNSYFFEGLGWEGICIEKNPIFNDSYKERTCHYVNEDALNIGYEKLFEKYNAPKLIDYLSLDVDEQSASVLAKLPLDKYRFRAITIEHDGHVYGDLYKKPQRELLKSKGYFLLGEDVLNQSGLNIGQEHGWEDWWADPNEFDQKELERLYSYRLPTIKIINKFK